MMMVVACASPESTLVPTIQKKCTKPEHTRLDAHTPVSLSMEWQQPLRLGMAVNSPCIEDAVEISRDGSVLFFYYAPDIFENLKPEEIFMPGHGTFRAERKGNPGDFHEPTFFNLGTGTRDSLDAALSFSEDGRWVYFHSARAENIGYNQKPAVDDFLDIYRAEMINGEPGTGYNLGIPVNSIHLDGEPAIHPNGKTLYFTSNRPGGLGGLDIWIAEFQGDGWAEPWNPGMPVNSAADDSQPAFSSDGQILYLASNRQNDAGMGIYQFHWQGENWGDAMLVIRGLVGEPSITGDGQILYFVHVVSDELGIFDADIWYSMRAH